jgi:hypothetical protein
MSNYLAVGVKECGRIKIRADDYNEAAGRLKERGAIAITVRHYRSPIKQKGFMIKNKTE